MKQLKLTITDDEHRALTLSADQAGISRAEYARRRILAAPRQAPVATRPPRAAYRTKADPAATVVHNVRLTPGEIQRIKQIADAEGLSRSAFIVRVIRTVIYRVPQPTGEIATALRESNRQLIGIAANLNQIARHMNDEPNSATSPTLPFIKQLAARVETNRMSAHQVLKACLDRWS